MIHLHITLQILDTLELNATLETTKTNAKPINKLERNQTAHLSVNTTNRTTNAKTIKQPANIELHQILPTTKLLKTQNALIKLLRPLTIKKKRNRTTRQLLHIKNTVNLKLQRKNNRLHTNHATKTYK